MDSTRKLNVRSAADMVTAVPYLLGFHPGDGSLVVIVCSADRVVFSARADLSHPDMPACDGHDLADHLIPVVQRQQPISAVVLLGYGDARPVDPALRTVGEAFTAAGLRVLELLRVSAGRFFSLTCTDRACCPPQGTAYDPTTSVVAVTATVAGLVALPERAAVAARFAPLDDAAQESMCSATLDALDRLDVLVAEHGDGDAVDEAGATAVREALRAHDAGTVLPDDEMAWLILLLAYTSVWNRAMELTEPHERHVAFWAEVTRRAHEPLVPAPAVLLALTAWRCGDGALAAMATERALQVAPDDEFARLLRRAIHTGIPPSVIEQALRGGEEHRTGEHPALPRAQDHCAVPGPADGGARRVSHPPQAPMASGKPTDKE